MSVEDQAAQGARTKPYFLYGDDEQRGDAPGIGAQATGDNLFGALGTSLLSSRAMTDERDKTKELRLTSFSHGAG